MKKIIFTAVLLIAANSILAQTYYMYIKQGNSTYSYRVDEIDEIIFFTCGRALEYEGESYPTILIGNQCWFAKNLNIGTRISGLLDQTNNGTIEKYCYANLNSNCTTYGGLYQWNEAMQYVTTEGAKGICPTGWHIPTYAEFQTLSNTVSGNGNALKAMGQGSGDGAGTNTSGFSALLAGLRYDSNLFMNLGGAAYFWSSTKYDATYAYYMSLFYNDDNINLDYYDKDFGFSVRCLQD